MTTSDTCRHGLLIYERDGQSFHRYDGERCEPTAAPTPSQVPEPLAYQRVGDGRDRPRAPAAEPAASPATLPARSPALAHSGGPPEAVKRGPIAPTQRVDTKRRTRPSRVAAAALTAVTLLAGGVAIGVAVRSATVDQQRQRVAAADDQIAALHDRVSGKQATIDDQQRQIAAGREEQTQLKRRNEQLARQATQTPAPTGANATSFTDGLYQAGSAIQAGQYRTDGSDNCYWAKLSAGDTNSVVESNLGAGPQTVTIDSPYFESEGCGTWTRLG